MGSGRLATLGPVFHAEFLPHPIIGEGYSTRVVTAASGVDVPLSPILDDQWLGVLVETGVAGVLALGWLFTRAIRSSARVAKNNDSARGWLLAGTAASVTGYAVSMLTYDAYGFIQETFLLFFILAIAASALQTTDADWSVVTRVQRRARALYPALAESS